MKKPKTFSIILVLLKVHDDLGERRLNYYYFWSMTSAIFFRRKSIQIYSICLKTPENVIFFITILQINLKFFLLHSFLWLRNDGLKLIFKRNGNQISVFPFHFILSSVSLVNLFMLKTRTFVFQLLRRPIAHDVGSALTKGHALPEKVWDDES